MKNYYFGIIDQSDPNEDEKSIIVMIVAKEFYDDCGYVSDCGSSLGSRKYG